MRPYKRPIRSATIRPQIVSDISRPCVPLEGQKVLIAITSCHKQRHYEQSQRETWIKDIPSWVDYKFFLGQPDTGDAAPDEVFLPIGDGYYDLLDKTKAVCKWALEHGYTYIYKTDTDTLVFPTRLLSSGFENYDHMGGTHSHTPIKDSDLNFLGMDYSFFFASGGGGYWLSARAMKLVVADVGQWDYEDVYVAVILHRSGIDVVTDYRYKFAPGSVLDSRTISYHISSILGSAGISYNTYTPDMMYKYYAVGKGL